jgi:site-specific DNA recombinase
VRLARDSQYPQGSKPLSGKGMDGMEPCLALCHKGWYDIGMNTRTIYGYIRVSTTRQRDEGVSLAAQRESIERWASAQGATVAGIFADEGVSGGKMSNRPAVNAALEAVCKAGGIIVVWNLSRLSRSVKDTMATVERLQKSGAEIVSLTESIDTRTAMGRAMIGMLAVFAQMMREQTGENTREAVRHLREQGRRHAHHAPFGFRFDDAGRMVQDEREAWIVERIRTLVQDYGMTPTAIARELEAAGKRAFGRTGKPLSRQQVATIASRKAA